MVTLSQAKSLKPGQTLYIVGKYNADGSPMRVRVSGVPKVWKREAGRVKVPVKRGLYDNGYIEEDNLTLFELEAPESITKAQSKALREDGLKSRGMRSIVRY